MTDSGVVAQAPVPEDELSERYVLPPNILDSLKKIDDVLEGIDLGLMSAAEAEPDPVSVLQRLLQLAVKVEFATIPPYLTAMYSIKDKRSQAYQLVRSVVMEEMVHLALASNLLKAAGGMPELKPPRYPCRVFPDPEGGGGPCLQLMAASPQLFRETFMRVEQPAEPYAPGQDKAFSTVGQLYKKIGELFHVYAMLDIGWPPAEDQVGEEWNFGNNGGTVIKVTNNELAQQAINEIIEQGEGADVVKDTSRQKYEVTQPWGQYGYYGPRADGTYGPVLGTPYEMSHYFKFRSIANGTTPLPETYPMIANPSPTKYKNQLATRLSELFDRFYTHLVDNLQTALQDPRSGQDLFFSEVMPVMRVAMPVLATQLMQIPVAAGAPHTSVDPTAGPSFHYLTNSPKEKIAEQIEKIIDEVKKGELVGGSPKLVAALRKVLDNIPPGLNPS